MPKNTGKGGKSYKASNSKGIMASKRDIIYADTEEGEEYAQVKRALGNLCLELQLPGGSTVIGVIRGAMVRKVWIGAGDVVLISKREFNKNDKVDVIHRYQPQEVRSLLKENAIPRDFRPAEEREENKNSHYDFVQQEEGAEEEGAEEEGNVIDRNEIVMDDPLAGLDDL